MKTLATILTATLLALGSTPARAWDIQVVDNPGTVGQYTSLAFDPAGLPAISYYDVTGAALNFARHDGTAWNLETVDATPPFTGQHTSLRFDALGFPAIAYLEGSARLKLARHDGTAWSIAQVDYGNSPSLAFDPAGNPAIAYTERTNNDLKLARHDGSVWTYELVDTAGSTGFGPSLAFDPAGNPAISYYDLTNQDLRFARHDGTAWTLELIDALGDTGAESSLAFDPAGNPQIAYAFYLLSPSSNDLKFARHDGTTWTVETVDAAGITGDFPSLAIDRFGNAAVAYLDSTTSSLRFAHRNGAAWTLETIEGNGAGFHPSVAYDAAGNPAISYFQFGPGDLKIARLDCACPTGGCVGRCACTSFHDGCDPILSFSDSFLAIGTSYQVRPLGGLHALCPRFVASATVTVTSGGVPSVYQGPISSPAGVLQFPTRTGDQVDVTVRLDPVPPPPQIDCLYDGDQVFIVCPIGCSSGFADQDGDGVEDKADSCPGSIVAARLVIGACDPEIGNALLEGGCTMADHVARCPAGGKEGEFVDCVARLAEDWQARGLIDAKQAYRLVACAKPGKPPSTK